MRGDQRMDELWQIDEPRRNECIQRSYVAAIASSAGFIVSEKNIDNGVDLLLSPSIYNRKRNKYEESGVVLRLQLKASRQWEYDSSHKFISYDLKAKTYNDMVSCNIRAQEDKLKLWNPIILVLHCVPKDGDLLKQNMLGTYIRKHSYWYLLNRQITDKIKNEDSTKRIHIPRSQILSPEALTGLGSRARSYWEEVSTDE